MFIMAQGFGGPKNRLGLSCLRLSDVNYMEYMIINASFHDNEANENIPGPNHM